MKKVQDKRIKLFGRNVKKYREREGITQSVLAYECGIATNTIAIIERGEINTSVLNAFKIAEALNIEPGQLFKES